MAKVYTICSASHRELCERFLAPSVPKTCELAVKEVSQQCPSGRYLEAGWVEAMIDKMDYVLETIERSMGQTFVFVDADVKFLSESAVDVMLQELGDLDIAFQRDLSSVCTGVFACAANGRTRELFRTARAQCRRHGDDQKAVNANLGLVRWRFLSSRFWNYSLLSAGGWNGQAEVALPALPADTLLIHANWTMGIENKKKLLELSLPRPGRDLSPAR